MSLNVVIDVAAFAGLAASIISLVVTCKNKTKLQDADANLKRELQEDDANLKRELQEDDANLKRELQEADHAQEYKITKINHDFEKEIFLLKEQFDAIPYFNEIKQKNNEIIYQYMDMIQNILDNDFKDDKFNDIQNKILACVPESLRDEIKKLNQAVNDYFLFKNPLDKDHIYDLYLKSLKEKLLSCIQPQTTITLTAPNDSYSTTSFAARTQHSVTETTMTEENVQELRKKAEKFNQ